MKTTPAPIHPTQRRCLTPAGSRTRLLARLLFAGALGLLLGETTIPAQDNQTQTQASRLDGLIVGADDRPLANAWVSVFSAAPRDGQRSTIPIKHYQECGRHVRTDAQGQFVFTGLNPDRLYRLLVSAPGHRPGLHSRRRSPVWARCLN